MSNHWLNITCPKNRDEFEKARKERDDAYQRLNTAGTEVMNVFQKHKLTIIETKALLDRIQDTVERQVYRIEVCAEPIRMNCIFGGH